MIKKIRFGAKTKQLIRFKILMVGLKTVVNQKKQRKKSKLFRISSHSQLS